MNDQRFSRIEQMIGPEGLHRLQHAAVTVVGLGAVGSYAVEALARAGIGRLKIVDFDEIRTSNINRQLYALESTIGKPKIDIARRRIHDINPACKVETLQTFAHRETLDQILADTSDLLIDAIDSYTPKVELLSAACQKNIPVISSMGAALRTDVNSIRVGPLSQTRHCRLARVIRKQLRRRKIESDFPCVYSIESVANLPENAVTDNDLTEQEFYSRGRKRRILGSLPTIPGIFGLAAANEAIKILLTSVPHCKNNPD